MPKSRARKIADAADVIVAGYAMLRHEQGIRVVNLFSGHVALVSKDCEMLATDMDDIEATIAVKHLKNNIEFMAA